MEGEIDKTDVGGDDGENGKADEGLEGAGSRQENKRKKALLAIATGD